MTRHMRRQQSVQRATIEGQRFLENRLLDTRHLSHELAAPLSPEDMTVQAMEDASPTKWHLAHVTWFFETFILAKHLPGYRVFDETFNYCFNSYYESQGARQPRPKRGLLTRPSSERVMAYRAHVDDGLARAARPRRRCRGRPAHRDRHQPRAAAPGAAADRHPGAVRRQSAASRLSPTATAVRSSPSRRRRAGSISRAAFAQVGHDGDGFAWDNEAPRHEALVHPFRLADRLVTNGEWLEFMADGGYAKPEHWLADGWATVNREGWEAPLYWEQRDGEWLAMSLEGLHAGRARGARLPRQLLRGRRLRPLGRQAAAHRDRMGGRGAGHGDAGGDAAAAGALRPLPAGPATGGLRQMYGHVWQWTQSAYLPYPGYRPPAGALGEYNGKFMVSQQVLRGGSCATPAGHTRATYRNFFYPHQRWQFVGLRLAAEIE